MKLLPRPESDEFNELVTLSIGRGIYRVLFEHQDAPMSLQEIRSALGLQPGEQEELSRRVRDLDRFFIIDRAGRGRDTTYQLKGMREEIQVATGNISKTVRAQVLKDQRCVQCGKTPSEDGVRLHVDHKIPQEWGGTDEIENLQALCSECNEGKKNYYATYNEFADELKRAANYDEPHRRIGELLKAFKGEPVPGDLIELVAKAKQYQDDWQKRLRELRTLGWEFSVSKKTEGKRVRTYYSLQHATDWPEGHISSEIRRREAAKKQIPEL